MSTPHDPDELARLEEQRAFLRRSLDDLDRELAAGDLGAADHAALAEDYRRRLAETEDGVARGRSREPVTRHRRWTRLVAAAVVVAVVAGAAGATVAAMAGDRRPGDTITGAVPQTTAQLLTEAARLATEGRITAALEIYDGVLDRDPQNVEALAERGLLLVSAGVAAERQVLVEQGRISIEQALRARPDDPRTLFYLGLALRLSGEDEGAAKALADALANDPPPMLRTQIEGFQAMLAQDESNGDTTTTTTTR